MPGSQVPFFVTTPPASDNTNRPAPTSWVQSLLSGTLNSYVPSSLLDISGKFATTSWLKSLLNNFNIGGLDSFSGPMPSFDYLFHAPDCIPPGQFTRNSTAYRTMNSGIIQTVAANMPRMDHDPVSGQPLGYFSEESRTNLLLYSNTLTNSIWALNSNNSISQNATGPDGVANSAATITFAANNNGIYQSVTTTNGSAYTGSIWLRTTSSTGSISVMTYGSSQNYQVLNVTSTWQRFTFPFTGSGSAQYFELRTDQPGATSAVTLQVFGAQFELGSFATSYIPTTSSSVSRPADNLVVPLSSAWFNTFEGTIYVEIFAPKSTSQTPIATFGGYGNGVYFDLFGSNIRAAIDIPGSTEAVINLGSISSMTGLQKIALTFNQTTLQAALNGTVSSTTFSTPPSFGSNLSVGTPGSCIRRLSYIPRAVSSAQLQYLTS